MNNSFVPGLTAIDGDRSYQWGPSDTDVRHVFVVNGTYEAPYGIRAGAILFARSGFPYTGVVGLDSDGDGMTATTLAIGPRRSAGTHSAIRPRRRSTRAWRTT